MRVVTKPRVSESEKPVEKPKEEGEEVNSSLILFLPVSFMVAGVKIAFSSSHICML